MKEKDADKLFNNQVFDWLTSKTNRSVGQTKFLYEVVGFNWKLLLELEEAIKVFRCCYCPGDLAESLYLVYKLRVWKSCGWLEEKNEYNLR